MTKIETIEFENIEKLKAALNAVIAGEDIYRSYIDKDNETHKKKIISKNRLYVGNNFSININQASTGKVYLSIDYFGVEDRIRMSQQSKTTSNKEL